MEEEKTLKHKNKAEDKEFVKRIIEFISSKKPEKTSDFVKAGFFENRSETRKVFRKLAEQSIIAMEKGKNKRYRYSLPTKPAGATV